MELLLLKNKPLCRFSNIVVLLVVILNVWFTNKVLNIYIITNSEPITLIGAWFAFTCGELWLLSGIKKAKIKKIIHPDVMEDMRGE